MTQQLSDNESGRRRSAQTSGAVRGLRVLYSFPHDLGSAGIGNIALHQVAGLRALGAAVTVYCGRDASGLEGPQAVETMRACGVRIRRRLIGIDRAYRWHDSQVARFLRKSASNFDIVHAWPLAARATLTAARAIGVRSVLERPNAHTRFAYETVKRECERVGLQLPHRHSHAANSARLSVEEEEYDLADRLLCPSTFVEQSFLRYGFPQARLSLHQYGYDKSRFHHLVEHEPPHRPFRLLFAARGEPRKGLHYALEAWHKSGIAAFGEFLICGNFVPGYREILGAALAHPSVKVLGFSGNMPELLRSCHAFILPSVEEGSALVTYEARACGCVLLASDATGAHATAGEDALIHAVGDVDTLTEQLRSVAFDQAFYQRLRTAGAKSVEHLSWDAAATRLGNVYLETINNWRGLD